jgi:hypothetical protein
MAKIVLHFPRRQIVKACDFSVKINEHIAKPASDEAPLVNRDMPSVEIAACVTFIDGHVFLEKMPLIMPIP